MQLKNKEKNKNRITHIIVAIIILLLYVFIFIPTDLIIKPTLPKNALDGITVTNIDRVSGTTTFTNKANDTIKYTYCTDAPATKSGWYTIKVNDIKYTMSNKDDQIIKKLAYNKCPLTIDCLKSDTDILPGTDAKITKTFIDYLLQNDIHYKIIFRGYSPTTKQLTYSINNDDPKLITLALNDIGFYKISETDDTILYCNNQSINPLKPFIKIGIILILFVLLFLYVWLDSFIDDVKVQKSQTNSPTYAIACNTVKSKMRSLIDDTDNADNTKIPTPEHKPSSTICSPGSKKKGNRK